MQVGEVGHGRVSIAQHEIGQQSLTHYRAEHAQEICWAKEEGKALKISPCHSQQSVVLSLSCRLVMFFCRA
jgi:hypothetical protein